MATKKDFVGMAKTIKAMNESDTPDKFKGMVQAIIRGYEEENSRFDRDMFIMAIGFDPFA